MAAFYDSDNNPTGIFADLGNCTNFAISIEEETLEHTSSREGLAKVDASVTLSKELGGSFTLDEYALEQLKAFLSADAVETAVAGATYTGADVDIPSFDSATMAGHWLELFNSSGDRVRNLSSLSVTGPSASPTYDINDDYLVDLDLGMLFIVAGGQIDTDDPASLEIPCTEAAGTNQEIRMLNETTIRAAIIFLGENAQTGEKFEIRLHKCKITAEGDQGWISNEYGTMDFNFVAEETTEAAYSASKVGHITFPFTS